MVQVQPEEQRNESIGSFFVLISSFGLSQNISRTTPLEETRCLREHPVKESINRRTDEENIDCLSFEAGGIERAGGRYEVTLPTDKAHFSREEVLEMIPAYEVLVPNFSFYTDREIMERGVKLELISNYGVGYNNIDVACANEKGIVVTNIPNTTREPTAEFAFGLLLAAGRRIGYYDRKLRSPEGVSWGVYAEAGLPVYGKRLGIIGMGRIGQSLARRALASGMEIVYHNRNRLDETIEKFYQARWLTLEELLGSSDYISLNAPPPLRLII